MTILRQQIAQMLIMGFAGTELDEQSSIAECLSGDGLGGVLLFDYDLVKKFQGKNLVSVTQIRRLTNQIKYYAGKALYCNDEPLVPFIALDYEGGAVDRLRFIEGCLTTKKPCELAKLTDNALRAELGKMAETLKTLGFNLNFAPVVDLNLNNEQGIIGKLGRSFSADADEAAHFARIFVEVFSDQGITCCYKHFPGHGSAVGDTHEGFVDVTETFEKKELEPYSLLLANNRSLSMIMTAHVINRTLDSSGLPATLSQSILTGLLRNQLGYQGVLISDDLQMRAIASHYSIDEALSLTINAGTDMLIFANQLAEIEAKDVIDRIERLVRSKVIERSRIEEAYQRIIYLKQAQMAFA